MSFNQRAPIGRRIAAPIAVAVALCGCGGRGARELPRAAVTGTVTLDGKPLGKGVIRFVPLEGTPGPKTSAMISQGQFSAEQAHGPVVGKHRIEIESTDDGGYALDDEEAFQKLRASGTRRIGAVRVPAVYNSRSTLTETVAPEGPNEFTFELISGKRRSRPPR